MRFPALLAFCLAVVLSTSGLAADWVEKPVPAYAEDVEFLVIGADGMFYAAPSNPNGYVLTSVLDKYRFEMTSGDGFSGKLLAGKDVVYLGASCDAVTGNVSGKWVNDSTGLNFVVEASNGQRLDFRFLSTGLQPAHSC